MRAFTTLALVVSAAATLVSAQQNSSGRKAYTADDLNDVGAVDLNTRGDWCAGQRNVCRELCTGGPSNNDCNPNTLEYDCECRNGTAPGLQYYHASMPTYICLQAYDECITTNIGNANEQRACNEERDSVCGRDLLHAADASGSDTTSSETSSATSSTTSSGTSATGDATQTTGGGEPTETGDGNFAAQTAAPLGHGAAALAIAVFAYLV